MSETPVDYGNAPPTLGQHTAEVLADLLGADDKQLSDWAASGVIGTTDKDQQ